MNIRCLIGHDFGPPQTTSSREEAGGEVVVTVREYRECSRCGERRLLSENKEVTSIERDTPAQKPEPAEADPDAETAEDFEDISAEDDDGIILDDGHDVDRRGHGEWPPEPEATEADEAADEHREWPEVKGEDEGFSATPGDGGPAEDVEFHGGLTPESRPTPPGETEDDEETIEAARKPTTRRGGGGSGQPGAGPRPAQQQRLDDVDTIFVCPECGHTAPAQGSSLRPGDICPECRRGYLAEREGAE